MHQEFDIPIVPHLLLDYSIEHRKQIKRKLLFLKQTRSIKLVASRAIIAASLFILKDAINGERPVPTQ